MKGVFDPSNRVIDNCSKNFFTYNINTCFQILDIFMKFWMYTNNDF